LSIFVAALVVVGRLVTWGSELALQSQLRSDAAQLCQTKLAEVRAGVEPLTSQHDMPFEDSPDWRWDLACEPQNGVPNLWQVQVRVSRAQGTKPIEITLSQWMLDPRSRGSVFDLAAYDSANKGTSSSSSNSSSGSTSGGH
jgi:hypothetical protein